MITITTATIDDAYNEVTTWRKNTFLVPYGKTGRDFIDQLTKHIDDWNNRSIELDNDRLFPEKYTVKDHISYTKLGKGDHYYIQTQHKDLFYHYNLILRKL